MRIRISALLLFFFFLLGCGTQPLPPPPPPATISQDQPHSYAIYVTEEPFDFDPSGQDLIAAYRVSDGNGLEAVNGSPFAAPSGISDLLAGNHGGFLVANTFDSFDFDTGEIGPNRGIYMLPIAPDGSLGGSTRVTHTFFPVSISATGTRLYVGEANNETSGHPINLSVYAIDAVTGQITLQPNAGVTIAGEETFAGQPHTTANGLWVKTLVDPLDRGTNSHGFLHFRTDSGSGAIISSSSMVTPDNFDLFSVDIARSEHFLMVLDGDFSLGPEVYRMYSVQNHTIGHIQDCVIGSSASCGFNHAIIHPSERFGFLHRVNSIGSIPLDLATGWQFDKAKSVPLPEISVPSVESVITLSPDGKILAVARFNQLHIFSVSDDGVLVPVKGSPVLMPISAPAIMAVATLTTQ